MQSEVAVRGEMRGFGFGVEVWYSGGKEGPAPGRLHVWFDNRQYGFEAMKCTLKVGHKSSILGGAFYMSKYSEEFKISVVKKIS